MADPVDPFRVVPIDYGPGARPVTEAEVRAALEQKIETAKTAALTFFAPGAVAVAAGLEGTLFGRAALGLAGLRSTPAGSRVAVAPTKFIATSALPAPFGYVPPETYGLAPDYLVGELTDNRVGRAIGIHSSPEREAVFAAQQRVEALSRFFEGRPGNPLAEVDTLRLNQSRNFLIVQQAVSPEAARLLPLFDAELLKRGAIPLSSTGVPPSVQTPRAVTKPIEELGAARGGPAPATNPIPGAPNSTFAPIDVKPNNLTAIGNMGNRTGINRELVTERADP